MILLEETRGQQAGLVAAHQDLHGLILDLAAHALDLALGDDIAMAEENDLVGDAIDLMEDVAGDDDVAAFLAPLLEERDGFVASHGIEAVQRLVEHQDGGAVRDRLRQLDALPHAFAIGRDEAVGGLRHGNALEGFLG